VSLSCSCEWGDEESDWYWWPPKEYSEYKRKRGVKCCCDGCDTLIRRSAVTGIVRRTRSGTMWEDDHGVGFVDDPESVNLANAYMCEECTDMYFSLDDLGFECVTPYENMRDLCKEYNEVYQGGEG
jgi:hypothetical protein